LEEQWEGFTLVNLINELSRNGNVEEIAEALQSIAKHILKKHRLRVLLTSESSQRDKAQKAVEKFLNDIPNETVHHSTALEVW
jgi:Zn-dependent M16 (insulinase) family peptidase